ncbi:Selenocysteine-specific elongation factor [bioreactor metagenome]|uniref:Selenocysteine-specific elongation factor n=1 Tax=bioreactor metagenome TaxID=1076179 RepID=A0A645I7M4_9ZZZZ
MRREALRTSLFPRLETGPADRILDRMITDGTLCAAGRCLALPTFGVLFTPEQEALKEKLLAASNHEPFAPPERSKLMTEMGRSKDFQKVLDYLTDEGELVPLEPDLLFSRAAMDEAERLLRELAAQNGEVMLAQFRDSIGTSRKYAMALLEYWDVTGITRKNGDARVLRS